MKSEVGMYVRYKRGSMSYNKEPADKIGKIINQINKSDIYELDNNNCVFENDIIKASYNIIDILEIGDYVNDKRIINITPIDICGDEILDNQHIFSIDGEIFENEIKSILTKEQFEQMSYYL